MRLLRLAALIICAAGISGNASATLIGTDVDVSILQLNGDTLETLYSSTVTVVDPHVELTGLLGSLDVNIGAESIRMDVTQGGPIPGADFLGFLFDQLLSAGTYGTVVGFSAAASNIAGFTDSRLSYDDVAVAFDLNGLNLLTGDYLEFTLAIEPVSVPEPGSLLLLGFGGALLLAMRRRQPGNA